VAGADPPFDIPADQRDRDALLDDLRRLGEQEPAQGVRIALCEVIAAGLARVGQVLWVSGAIVGPHRVTGESRHGFGDDRVVGVATVAQIGGELARGCIALLRSGNRYGASALVRQLLEVEYLAHAFAGQHESAAEWLRADRDERRAFWTPQKVRARADGAFIGEHYWSHCDRGGHPTTEGLALLPDHSGSVETVFLWVDLAGHLASVWGHMTTAAALAYDGAFPAAEWNVPDVGAALEAWRSSDDLYAALAKLNAARGSDG
jgi:hypothetical protein